MNSLSAESSAAKRDGLRYSLRSMLLTISLLSVILFVATFLYDSVAGSVLPYRLLQQLNAGMTAVEVEAVLGSPARQNHQTWIYERSGNPGWVEIEFDEQGKYLSYNDESAYPAQPPN